MLANEEKARSLEGRLEVFKAILSFFVWASLVGYAVYASFKAAKFIRKNRDRVKKGCVKFCPCCRRCCTTAGAAAIAGRQEGDLRQHSDSREGASDEGGLETVSVIQRTKRPVSTEVLEGAIELPQIAASIEEAKGGVDSDGRSWGPVNPLVVMRRDNSKDC